MTAARTLLEEGRLQEAIAAAVEAARKQPADSKQRILLFQLQVVNGNWEKAATQLDVMADLDAATLPMVQTYRMLLRCEAEREAVFAGSRQPTFMGSPQPWAALLVEALQRETDGAGLDADRLREEALEQAEAVPGTVNDMAFAWIADADGRLGPILEAVVNGRYFWVPFEQLRAVQLEAPADLRDLVWLPAQLTFLAGGTLPGFIPSRYPATASRGDDLMKLCRRTEWLPQGEGREEPVGQRMFVTDRDDQALLEIRSIVLAAEGTPPGETSAA